MHGRWWEGYLVRYLLGTPIGGVCVLAIANKVLETIPDYLKYRKEIFDAVIRGDFTLNASAAVVLGFLALVYCYVASAPITIIHATRMFRGDWYHRTARPIWLAIFVALVALIYVSAVYTLARSIATARFLADLMVFFIALPALWVVFAQVLCIMRLHLDEKPRPDVWFASPMYRRLCLLLTVRRVSELPDADRGQFVRYYSELAIEREKAQGLRESYTHLREHANSVFIAVFEISLAALVYFVLDRAPSDFVIRVIILAAVIFVWLVPNVFLWAQANRLEASLVKGAQHYGTNQLTVLSRDELDVQEAGRS
jgi:hypothetical protein